jgi:hypothetical protein
VPREDRHALPLQLAPLYLATQQQLVLGKIMGEELGRAFGELPRVSDALIPIDATVVSVDERIRRAFRIVGQALRIGDVSLASWADLLRFAETIEGNADHILRLLDVATVETLDAWQQQIDHQTVDEDRRMTAEMCVILANFIRLCEPRVRRRGYRVIQALDEADSAAGLFRDRNSQRDIRALDPAS